MLNKEQIMEILPHRPPMLLVDEILEMDENHVVGALHLSLIHISCILFGDGAAAAVYQATEDETVGILSTFTAADGSGAEYLHCLLYTSRN